MPKEFPTVGQEQPAELPASSEKSEQEAKEKDAEEWLAVAEQLFQDPDSKIQRALRELRRLPNGRDAAIQLDFEISQARNQLAALYQKKLGIDTRTWRRMHGRL